MGQYKAALFDLDGTLIDRVAAFGRVAGALHDEELAIQAVISRDDFVELMVVWDEDGNAPREDVYGLILQYWPGVTRSLQELLAFHNRTQPISTLPDERVVAFLRELHATGMPWGVITNGGSTQRPKVASSGFDDIVPFVVVSGEVGYEKPDPRIYQDGLKQLGGISAADTLFVGDNVETDIGGAQSAGMPTAWVKRGREWPAANQPPDYQIDHVDELRAMLL
jgi:putative hydrolase of the HAD superfamily